MTNYYWSFPEIDTEDIDFGEDLFPQIETILKLRGIQSKSQLQELKAYDFGKLHSPFLMKDMDKAVNRVLKALEENQRILVYGDYDVDGTTAIALVYSFLKDRDADVDFYVPDRYAEGYGVSEKGVQTAVENNVNLLITLDCGIKANKMIAKAQAAGIDVIVCDHHNQGETLPEAYAVLDPKRHDCEYPFKELSGCGVGYKLMYALCCKLGLSVKDDLNKYLDYLAISTAADIVPITGENRVYMHYGLMKMCKKPLVPIKTMLVHSKLISLTKDNNGEEVIVCPNKLTVSDIVFRVAPKINAAGRMESARDAINLLLAKDEQEASQFFSTVVVQNSERQEKEKIICDEALSMIKSNPENSYSTVLYKEDWHKGVVGIAAAKVIESYYKPTVILCGEGDVISGSARSVSDFDLYSAVDSCSDFLAAFGGHKHAAGLSMKKENLELFRNAFEEAVAKSIKPYQQQPSIKIDAQITLDEIVPEFYKQVQYLAPFGPENMDPVFAVLGVKPEKVYFMGNEEVHLRMNFRMETGNTISAVGFFMAEKWKNFPENSKVDICFTIGTNTYRGLTSLQLHLKDVRLSNEQ
ncbi:MAG: single-stranded-DNA-specific exonuclease RecJ [Bacteroidales bacterium]|nr:single-stranded-DNA-specific exonuclease RecJ [Bacteroidales bacterium]